MVRATFCIDYQNRRRRTLDSQPDQKPTDSIKQASGAARTTFVRYDKFASSDKETEVILRAPPGTLKRERTGSVRKRPTARRSPGENTKLITIIRGDLADRRPLDYDRDPLWSLEIPT
jgi:hypothetical protein